MTLPTGLGNIIALVVLVVCVVGGLLHLLPLLLAALIGGLAVAKLVP